MERKNKENLGIGLGAAGEWDLKDGDWGGGKGGGRPGKRGEFGKSQAVWARGKKRRTPLKRGR